VYAEGVNLWLTESVIPHSFELNFGKKGETEPILFFSFRPPLKGGRTTTKKKENCPKNNTKTMPLQIT
jgi:hypothetical protein